MSKGELAKKYFLSGYNCAQSVACAFCEEMGMDVSAASRLASGFGGGIGGMREVCGAVSGMVLVLNALYGGYDVTDRAAKAKHYETVRSLCEQYQAESGSIICRELLGLSQDAAYPGPAPRTKEYYQKRPCPDIVARVAEILEQYLSKQKSQQEGVAF